MNIISFTKGFFRKRKSQFEVQMQLKVSMREAIAKIDNVAPTRIQVEKLVKIFKNESDLSEKRAKQEVIKIIERVYSSPRNFWTACLCNLRTDFRSLSDTEFIEVQELICNLQNAFDAAMNSHINALMIQIKMLASAEFEWTQKSVPFFLGPPIMGNN